MKKKLSVMLSVLLTSALLFTACGSKQTSNSNEESSKKESGKIMCIGSSTLAPVVSKAGDTLKSKHGTWKKMNDKLPDENIELAVSSGGSGAGVKAALEKTANFGLISREVSKDEKAKMKEYNEIKIGYDALTLSVNPQNLILKNKKGLTSEEIQKIFSGEAKTWKDVDPSLPANKIVLVVRDAGGGAAEVFQKAVMGDKKVSKDAVQAPSMGALTQKVIENKDAIGYASVGLVDQNKGKLTPMEVDGIAPTKENITSGKYKIARPLLLIKDGKLTGVEQTFVDFLKSEEGLKIIDESGFVSIK
ncbi:phosphate ABC transporter substrate-binding protein [Clostridium botulinum]|uniref:Phosphate ABC transporter substrate-binding protein n=2 Tax=Clostridium botulinum TaxID=1491 RepID=A0A846I3X4_CLOBO|nr:phosphate ABC transporter substrate-binding protein [Clostridium botulinum]AJD27910.1 phosphate binding family protein [Clostridium botulinum CDC_297]ACQ54216.1 phosphate uptake ABC transporter, PhoT family, phosphate-binding protein [Clostridium botulinum Ba4 str. 657]AJE11298.1 phosphate binding family protein [Clostridium botulinum CDC_1436]AXG92378.1 phosphate ABC transporter substrate-binding protein [Clostridium botulinum]EDT87332.1 phosphate uptake ABC transporter, PhoT family, phosp